LPCDTIEIHRQRMRIWGIDAPESDQLCSGSDSCIRSVGAVDVGIGACR
jgi:endonuclease YncB( thermonuclease family)